MASTALDARQRSAAAAITWATTLSPSAARTVSERLACSERAAPSSRPQLCLREVGEGACKQGIEVDRTGQHVNRGGPLRRVIHTRQEDGLLITLPCCAVVSGQSGCCVGRAGWRVRAHGLVQSYDFGNELIAATPDVHDEARCPALLAQQVAVGVRGLEASGFSSNELQAMFSQNALRILPRRT